MNNNLIVALLIFIISSFSISEARRGCCSHHGGVCGCQCCDGTPLSAKCAPYYPDCGRKQTRQQPNQSNKINLNKEIQRKLKILGYYKGNIDGIFGSGTKNAIKRFQKDNDLLETGTINYATNNALSKAILSDTP